VSFCFWCHRAIKDGKERKLQKDTHHAFIEGGFSNWEKIETILKLMNPHLFTVR
jgi:hypothetical protein